MSLARHPTTLLTPFFLFPLHVCLHNSGACKRLNDVAEAPYNFISAISSRECMVGVGGQFHMRGLPPHQAVFKEEQQVAAGRENLRLSGCQSGIAAESRLFI